MQYIIEFEYQHSNNKWITTSDLMLASSFDEACEYIKEIYSTARNFIQLGSNG